MKVSLLCSSVDVCASFDVVSLCFKRQKIHFPCFLWNTVMSNEQTFSMSNMKLVESGAMTKRTSAMRFTYSACEFSSAFLQTTVETGEQF